MNTSYTNDEYAKVICTRYITPRVQSLSACRADLRADQNDLLKQEALYVYMIVTCHQLISFLGISHTNDQLTVNATWPNNSYLQINARNCGGKAVNVDELTNIRKSLLTEMLLTAGDIHHIGHTMRVTQLKDLYLHKGGIDYLFLLLKQNFYAKRE
ncbi:MAG: hypothetical protein LRY55_16105 [Leadbetterella sp.]|nr:hypothetical protein [Leadbetterella sp.]